MKSARAEALRWILPLLPRIATVDFFGADDFFETVFDFDDVLCAPLDEDRDDTRPFCAVAGKGSRKPIAIRATPIRFNMVNLPVFVGIIEGLKD